jgi:hypothetical protein
LTLAVAASDLRAELANVIRPSSDLLRQLAHFVITLGHAWCYRAAMPEFANQWEEWEKTIRDPAEQTKEPMRKLDCGPASAEYQTAQLPDDRWAIRFKCQMDSGSGMAVPWRAFATRAAAVAYFRQEAAAFFRREERLKAAKEQARRKILALLTDNGLFGFTEPEPEKEASESRVRPNG